MRGIFDWQFTHLSVYLYKYTLKYVVVKMMKRVIVAGCNGRGDYDDYNGAKEFIEICIN